MPDIIVNEDGIPKLAAGDWRLVKLRRDDKWPSMVAFGCPCGREPHGTNAYIYLANPPGTPGKDRSKDYGPSWHWDGNFEAPTLSPSIARKGGCNWHGYLQQGKFVSV